MCLKLEDQPAPYCEWELIVSIFNLELIVNKIFKNALKGIQAIKAMVKITSVLETNRKN